MVKNAMTLLSAKEVLNLWYEVISNLHVVHTKILIGTDTRLLSRASYNKLCSVGWGKTLNFKGLIMRMISIFIECSIKRDREWGIRLLFKGLDVAHYRS